MFISLQNIEKLALRSGLLFFLMMTIHFKFAITTLNASQFSPAIIVNNISISKYEVNERRKLLLALGTEKNSAKQLAKENLINEALQKLHASTINVSVGESQLMEVFNRFLNIRSMSQNDLKISLRKFGSSVEELKAYLKANVLMRNIITKTYQSRMTIDDFDFKLFKPTASTTIPTQINLSEIVIPFSIRGRDNTIKLGERIFADLKKGKEFKKLARRFSRSSTAKTDGLIGFVQINSIPEKLRKILTKLKSGNISNPIITNDTVIIFKVNSWKTSERTGNFPTEVTFGITNNEKADTYKKNCQSLNKNELQGPISENSLKNSLKNKIKLLRPSESTVYNDDEGKETILILCDRRVVLSKEKLNVLKGQMLEKRLLKLAEGLNLQLKRTANIKFP